MREQLKAIVKLVAEMTNEQQILFYEGLAAQGLTEEHINLFKSQVTFWKMENVPGFKKWVMETMGNELYNRLRAQ